MQGRVDTIREVPQLADFEDTGAQLREDRILHDRIRSELDQQLVPLGMLMNSVDRIYRDRNELLSGLGFA